MIETVNKLKKYLNIVETYFVNASESEIHFKKSVVKWSKIEILGHLIDSGLNNLQRFTEIQFESKPYAIQKYNQDLLVIANGYQESNLMELIGFWLSINKRIIHIMQQQTDESLNYEIKIDNEFNNLKFLMIDYVDHLKHHINQIID